MTSQHSHSASSSKASSTWPTNTTISNAGAASDQEAPVVSGQNHDRGFATAHPLVYPQFCSPALVASKARSGPACANCPTRSRLFEDAPLSFSLCGRSVKKIRLKCRIPEEFWRFVGRQTEVPQAQKQVLSLDALLFWADVMEAPDAWKERLRERENEGKRER